MKRKTWVSIAIFYLLFLQLFECQSQKIEKNITFNWNNNKECAFSEDYKQEFLDFQNAVSLQEYPSLPAYFELIPVDVHYDDYEILLSNLRFEPLNEHDATLIPAEFQSTSIIAKVTPASQRNREFATLTIFPFIKTGNGRYSKLLSATITIEGKNPISRKSVQSHPSQSILATGSWYSFTLTETGIYKVTYSDLAAMGIQAPIASAQIALFGNSGRMLPEANSTPRIEDLRELPICIVDGNDGTFDNGDYFLFYGESPHSITFDTTEQHFSHLYNVFSDSSRYFITTTAGVGQKKRVTTIDNNGLTATQTVSDYTHFDFYETDQYNLCESGNNWFGELFDITTLRNFTFKVPGYTSSTAFLNLNFGATSTVSATMKVSANGSYIGTMGLAAPGNGYLTNIQTKRFSFTPTNATISIDLDYQKTSTSSSAYLDWIEIEVPCLLSMHSAQFPFCNPSTSGIGNITQFNIGNANASTSVWDVTNPAQIVQYALTANGNSYSFKTQTDSLKFFYAFDGTQFLSITPGKAVPNQNLHATNEVDLIIVTHPDFLTQANRLADFRRSNDGLTVKVVTTQQIYNEFSSGSQDPIAIRDYMKMIYDKTNKQYPKYLLLFGRPCYDFRGRVSGTSIFVPNSQKRYTKGEVSEFSFTSNDDYFGLLDDNEGDPFATGLFDVPIGRFPASTVAQATTAVDKSIRYTEHRNLVPAGASPISNFGDWRNVIAFVADDEEGNDFISHADMYARIIENQNPNINFDKIYLDAYQQVSNAGGQRYPEVTTAINNRMNRGSLFFTYIGHSGKDGWAAERILENSDINKWTNKFNLPVMLTLSCSFGYYDRPSISPAELVLFNNNGGASALITTTREAWSFPNNSFGEYVFSQMFNKSDGHYSTIGELEILGKNRYGGSSSSLAMFVLMGDPSMPLAIPTYNIVTDSINHQAVNALHDTIKALSKMTISGHIVDENHQLVDNFNGTIYPAIYDKKVATNTLVNDPTSNPFTFDVQKSVLFKGNCSVNNGRFSFSFYVPKDIDYDYGYGKISYYACSSNADGAGAFNDFIIGGTDTASIEDKEGPSIELFLNDESFVNGGISNQNPMLIAKIKDNYGINTTGNGIGHDLSAIIDNATEAPIILNDYYETEKDSFNMGTVRYQLSDISVGTHTIMVRAWDINNNHAENEITFEVASDEKLTLNHVLNYPNPFTTHTEFFFEQNQNGGTFDIQIQIYTISGKLLKTINETQHIEGNRSTGIVWDGRDDYGDKIGKGVYIYKLRVRNQNNEIAEEIEKIAIL